MSNRTLSQGAEGQDVRALQDVLNFHVRRGEPLRVDGQFGPKTRARVVEFQRANGLAADGLVGPKTNAQLYEVTVLPVPMLFLPRLRLDPPAFGAPPAPGIPVPRLVPPLQWPGPPSPPPFPFVAGRPFVLAPHGPTPLPAAAGAAHALNLQITVPTRKDPADPRVASRQAILELIDDLPVDAKFRGLLASQVPNPVTKIAPPGNGFRWGLAPLFDPFDPTGFGVKGNARFTLRLTDGGAALPTIHFAAWGDGKFFLKFDTQRGESRPTVQAEGEVFGGVGGVF